jgi:hypothetical protein
MKPVPSTQNLVAFQLEPSAEHSGLSRPTMSFELGISTQAPNCPAVLMETNVPAAQPTPGSAQAAEIAVGLLVETAARSATYVGTCLARSVA